MFYAKHTERSWFFIPTLWSIEYEDGERAFGQKTEKRVHAMAP